MHLDQNALKKAQARAVIRLGSLERLLGSTLYKTGRAFEVGADSATPLSLLRGLGWTVGGSAKSSDAATIASLHKVDSSFSAEEAEGADLVLYLGLPGVNAEAIQSLTGSLSRLKPGAALVVEIEASGSASTLRGRLASARALIKASERQGGKLIAHAILHQRIWLAFERDGSTPAVKDPFGLWTLAAAAAIGPLGKGLSAAWQLLSHPHGRDLAALRLKAKLKKRSIARQNAKNKKPLYHFGVHTPANAGDLVLFETVRAAIDTKIRLPWNLVAVRDKVTDKTVHQINTGSGLIIGGGGLFLVDNAESSSSGWQWPISTDLMRKIEVPMAVFAVGYNRFRGHGEFPQVFSDSLNLLVEKAGFVGIRNSGSIRALTQYLPEHLAGKLTYQPCPTTVLSYLDMPRSTGKFGTLEGQRKLVINGAFDRFALRFQGNERAALGGIARMARAAQDRGWKVIVVGHLYDDEAIMAFLRKENVEAEIIHFTNVPTADILAFYESVDLVAGMRGHAQMIPFGVGTPIISLVAHDKMGWFLEDIGHQEWGVELTAPDATERLLAAFSHADENLPMLREQVKEAKARLWDITQRNVAQIAAMVG